VGHDDARQPPAERLRAGRLIATILIALAAGAALLTLLVRLAEPRFAFLPLPGETTTPDEFGIAFERAMAVTADGERLRVWHLHGPSPRAVIVYFHGNGGNLSVWAPILSDIARHGYEVIAPDYRGYGASTGRPSERGLYRDVDAVVDIASRVRVPMRPLVYWGRSLGTAMAAYASTRNRPDALILEAGFPDARSLLRASPPLAVLGLFSSYRFPTAGYANNGGARALVLHGTADSVIPFALGRALYEQLAGEKEFVEIPGGDHNDARPRDERAYWHAIDAFIGR
jgi:fermentation-respiration switch protein FrsA (DUF1100 family)